ncbi:hypothetical protein HaLaN_11581, partial [Haematococcus lacustris]
MVNARVPGMETVKGVLGLIVKGRRGLQAATPTKPLLPSKAKGTRQCRFKRSHGKAKSQWDAGLESHAI